MIVASFTACSGEKEKNQKSEKLSPEEIKYNEAMEYIENGKYTTALDIIIELGDFKDCKELREKFVFKCSKAIDDISEITYTYDDKGNQLTYELISDELPWEKSTYTYNDKNQLVEQIDEGYNPCVWKLKYDLSGNHILTEFSGATDEGKINYEYDSNGNCIKEHWVHKPHGLNSERITTFVYDENGNCIEETPNNSEPVTYIYDENNLCIKEYRGYSTVEYTYDDDGCCNSKRITGDTEVVCYVYEYDKYGNRIRSDYVRPMEYDYDTTTYEYVLFYDGKRVNDYVQPTIAKDDLTVEEILEISRKTLLVPNNDNITYTVGGKYYDIGKGLYYVPVAFYEDGETVACANIHIKTGELVSNIMGYNANR